MGAAVGVVGSALIGGGGMGMGGLLGGIGSQFLSGMVSGLLGGNDMSKTLEVTCKHLEGELSHAQVIDIATLTAGDRVVFGATVQLADVDVNTLQFRAQFDF